MDRIHLEHKPEKTVTKQSPVPEVHDAEFWGACNEGRLVLQYCHRCEAFQHPPEATCGRCHSAGEDLVWREVSGAGSIHSFAVVYDSPIAVLQLGVPFNVAVIELDDAPGVTMLSHLPGTPVDEVPIGGRVELSFETTSTGQKVPEWRVVG